MVDGYSDGGGKMGRIGFLSLREGSRGWDGEASRDVRMAFSVGWGEGPSFPFRLATLALSRVGARGLLGTGSIIIFPPSCQEGGQGNGR